ncbi:hypothetical protein [Schleiferilactobacillus perolens]|nr:hypothetical protein [Schleiferilactobacillus perolens]
MTVRSRRQGKSIIIPIPSEFGVKPNSVFDPEQLSDGTIQFTPHEIKYPDIWNDDPETIAQFNRQIGLQDRGHQYGRENADS